MALTSAQRQAVVTEAGNFDITPKRVAEALQDLGPDERKDWAGFFEELGLDANYHDGDAHPSDGSTGNINVVT